MASFSSARAETERDARRHIRSHENNESRTLVVVERVAIVGPSGAGKTTLAGTLAERIGATVIDLDALFHQENWQPSPTAEFRARVAESLETPRWCVAGNYSQVLDLVHGSADTIIWLDLPRGVVTWRVAKRSIRRVVMRETLWNGNRERLRRLLSRDPETNIIVWAWTEHGRTAPRYEGFAAGVFWEHADVYRLRSANEVEAFLDAVPPR